jgi:DegV family protein with EDD domain
MQIVTDRGVDIAPEQLGDVKLVYAPLRLILDGKTYTSGVDLTSAEFYELLSQTESYPTTSQPSSGEFAELYRQLAKDDPEILSIHISSGLSGTLNAALAGAEMVPEAHVTFWDTKTLSCPMGWQVEAAVRGLKCGLTIPQILERLAPIRQEAQGIYTVATMKYLIHGGRISHIKGLMASLLNIKPIIGVEKERGTYYELGREVTLKRAIGHQADVIERFFPRGSRVRVQPMHGNNPEGVELLQRKMNERYDCNWMPVVPLSPVLGAHTGAGLVGMAVGPDTVFGDLPPV